MTRDAAALMKIPMLPLKFLNDSQGDSQDLKEMVFSQEDSKKAEVRDERLDDGEQTQDEAEAIDNFGEQPEYLDPDTLPDFEDKKKDDEESNNKGEEDRYDERAEIDDKEFETGIIKNNDSGNKLRITLVENSKVKIQEGLTRLKHNEVIALVKESVKDEKEIEDNHKDDQRNLLAGDRAP